MNLSEEAVFEKLKNVIDPELFVNVVDLGLIYEVKLKPAGATPGTAPGDSPGAKTAAPASAPSSAPEAIAPSPREAIPPVPGVAADDVQPPAATPAETPVAAAPGPTTDVFIQMTMTSPACPAGPQLISGAKREVATLSGVGNVEVKIVLDPPWTPDRMTEEAKDQLGIF
jgi:metal-sulfur cluster biosynthetic enzyme